LRGPLRELLKAFLENGTIETARREPVKISGEPVTQAQGEPDATGQEEALLSHEIRLHADYASLVRIEDLPLHA
jgi:hypothetical protein